MWLWGFDRLATPDLDIFTFKHLITFQIEMSSLTSFSFLMLFHRSNLPGYENVKGDKSENADPVWILCVV